VIGWSSTMTMRGRAAALRTAAPFGNKGAITRAAQHA